MPVLPLFGRGDVKLQPVYVGDVAEAAAEALAAPETQGKTYELGGPRVYPYKELLRLVLAATGRKRLLIPVPYLVWVILALLMSPLPRAPISRDQVTLMKCHNVVAADALTLVDLGIAPTSVETVLPGYRR
jgi:NADH dehydrogenase